MDETKPFEARVPAVRSLANGDSADGWMMGAG